MTSHAHQPDSPADIVAVGSWTNFDHLFQVDRLPAPGDTVEIRSPITAIEAIHWGGCAPNVAAAATSLGVCSALVSVAGRDFRERGYEAHLRALGVDTHGVIVAEDDACGHSFLFSDPSGATICLSHLGAAARQEEFAPDAAVLSAAKIAVITYRFDRFTLRAAQLAAEAGARVVVSGNLTTSPAIATELIGVADIVICTDHELALLIALLGLASPIDLFALGVESIAATRGSEGSTILTPTGETFIPVVPAQVVDPVGAGDAFAGGFAAGLARGLSLADAARLGAAVASFVVEALGCQTNLPTLDRVRDRVGDLGG
jgi:nucleoside kinase